MIKGAIFSAVLGIVAAFFVPLTSLSFLEFIEAIIFAFIPMGYCTISRVFGKDPYRKEKNTFALFGFGSNNSVAQGYAVGYFLVKFIIFLLKLVVSYFIGIPCVIYLIVKLKSVSKQISDAESNYSTQVDSFINEMESEKNN